MFILNATETFMLIYWPEEDGTSVVKQSAVLKPQPLEHGCGVFCTVKFGKQICDGRIAGIGKLF